MDIIEVVMIQLARFLKLLILHHELEINGQSKLDFSKPSLAPFFMLPLMWEAHASSSLCFLVLALI